MKMTAVGEHVSSADTIQAKQGRSYESVKRILDVAIALVVLLLFAPLWIIIACAVRLTSPGPVLFRLREVGKGGREFTMYKFRTMYHNNDDSLHRRAFTEFIKGQPLSSVIRDGVSTPIYKIVNDPRVTPFGRLLRRTGLDEVPQFLSVLRGDMSVVGPRPAQYYEYELYSEYHRKRLDVFPGITGLYQVTARSQVTCDEMVAIDLDYIQRRSLWLDLKIMLLTPWIMITGKGAH